MRRILMFAAVFVFALLLTLSCSKDDDSYSLGKIWISMGLIETENTFGYDFIIYCDNGDTLLPAANSARYFEPKNNQRVIANYTKLGDVTNSEKQFYVKVNNLSNVLFKDVIPFNEEIADSLGSDPIDMIDMWLSGDMLNIEFQYAGGNRVHYINLVYNTNENGEIDESVELEFKHNANDDELNYALKGIVTFKLNNLRIEGQNETNIVVNWTNYNGESKSNTGTYKY